MNTKKYFQHDLEKIRKLPVNGRPVSYTAQGGEYFASGVGGAITGRGADLLIIDDPHSEQDAMNKQALERAYEWYTSGPRQRLQPGGSIVCVMTRWNTKDLTGMLLQSQKAAKQINGRS